MRSSVYGSEILYRILYCLFKPSINMWICIFCCYIIHYYQETFTQNYYTSIWNIRSTVLL